MIIYFKVILYYQNQTESLCKHELQEDYRVVHGLDLFLNEHYHQLCPFFQF